MRFRIFPFVAFAFLVAASHPARAADPVKSVNILFIAGGDAGSSHLADELASLRTGLLESGVNASIFMEALDEMRFGLTEDVMDLVTTSITRRFGSIRFDIILAQGLGAVEYAVRYRDARAPRLPLYAFDILEASTAIRFADEKDIYGRILGDPFPPTFRIAAKFFPRARKAVLVVPKGKIGNKDFLDLVEAEKKEFPSLIVETLSSVDAEGIDAAFASGKGEAFGIVMTREMTVPGGKRVSNNGIAEYLLSKYEVPLFYVVRPYLGSGFIGGYSNDEERIGREAASMVNSILFGEEKPKQWGASGQLALSLDDRALKKYSIPRERVPEDAEIQFAPPPLWIRYQTPLQLAGVFLILLSIVLVAIVIVRRHDREALKRSNAKLEAEVARRTEELSTANTELESANANLVESLRRIEAMQDRLAADARDVVLGRLALGLAHEINNPLGAISASNTTMLELVSSSPKGIAPTMLAMDRPRLELFVSLAARKSHDTINLASPTHDQKAALTARLERLGVGDPSTMSDLVWDAGEERLEDDQLVELCAPANRSVLEGLFLVSALARSVAVSEVAARKIAQTIESIRSYARDDADSGSKAAVDVASSIEDALRLLGEAEERYKSIRKDVNRSSLGPVVAERASLARLWANLAQNAIDAAGESGDVLVRAYDDGPHAVVEVSDSGPGVPESLRDRLFEPMATPLGEGFKGMGLGLSICKRIVDGAGGSIEYDDSSGRTVFRVRLPLAGR